MPKSRKAAAGGSGGTGKTKAGGAKKKSKRAVAGVGVDFSRVKRKVGRTLAPAANATDTTVSSKSITLPSQSVAEARKGVAVSDRNLTLQELLSQLSHYSAKVRRDALQGIEELASRSPSEIRRHSGGNASSSSSLSPLEALAERAADADASVRSSLRSALGAVASAVGPAAVVPFLPLLMAHARRAMGSPDASTRADALALAAVAVSSAAAAASSKSSFDHQNFALLVGPALSACAAQLNPAARSRSLKAGSLASLAASLKGIRAFLEAAAAATGGGEDDDEEEDEGEDESDDDDGRPLFSFRCSWPPAALAVAPAAEGVDGGGEEGEGGEEDDDESDDDDDEKLANVTNEREERRLLPAGVRSLLAALASAWTDLCPRSLAGGGAAAAAATAVAASKRSKAPSSASARATERAADEADDDVERSLAACDLLACARLLLLSCPSPQTKSSASSSSASTSAAMLKAASPLALAVGSALPAPPPSEKGTARRDALDAAAELNVESARFLGKLLSFHSSGASPSCSSSSSFSSPPPPPPWTERLAGWCDAALETGDALPRGDGGGGDDGDGSSGGDGDEKSKKRKKAPTSSAGRRRGPLRPLPDSALSAVVAASERALAVVASSPAVSGSRSVAHARSLSALAARSPPRSRGRGVAVGAIRRALLTDSGSSLVAEEAAASWVPLLPRVVWEEASPARGGKKGAPATAAAALAALHAAARRCRRRRSSSSAAAEASPLAAALRDVAPLLAPLVLVMPPPSTSSSSLVSCPAGALARLPPRCALLLADAIEHLPAPPPLQLLRAVAAAAASPSSPYEPEFAERALSAAARAFADEARGDGDESDDGGDEEGGEEEKERNVDREAARAWASTLLFLLSGAGERVAVVSCRPGDASAPPPPSDALLWERHERVVAVAVSALRASSSSCPSVVASAVALLAGGLLEAAGVVGEGGKGGEDGGISPGRRARAAAGALAALRASAVDLVPPSSSPLRRLLDAVPRLVAAFARGGGVSALPPSKGAELALSALRARCSSCPGALGETLDLLLSPSESSSATAAESCSALVSSIAGDARLRSFLLEKETAEAARGAVRRARSAAAAAAAAEERGSKPSASSAAAAADAALAAALGS